MASRGRSLLFRRQSGGCHYCQRQMTLALYTENSVTRDHVVPRSRCADMGVVNDASNLVGACWRCNALKGDMTGVEFLRYYANGIPPFHGVWRKTARPRLIARFVEAPPPSKYRGDRGPATFKLGEVWPK